LRGETFGVTLFRCFWFQFEGAYFLKKVVKPLVVDVIALTKSKPLEIDSNRVGSKDIATKNIQKLISITTKFLKNLYTSSEIFSFPIISIFKEIYIRITVLQEDKLGLGFSDDALRLFGGFLLLRCIAPPVVTPQKYKVVKEKDINLNAQRALILISKVIQGIANQVEFDGEKEPYMVPINTFVKDQFPEMMGFITNIVEKEQVKVRRNTFF